jgi:smad nuclear-interacting protein 1
MDLDSTNGTFLQGEKIETGRYYELKEGDVVKIALSSREYVLLHEDSKM